MMRAVPRTAVVSARTRREITRDVDVSRFRRASGSIRAVVSARAMSETSSTSSPDDEEGAFLSAAAVMGAPTLATLIYPTFFVREGLGLECATPLFGETFDSVRSVQHFSNAFGTSAFALIALTALYTLSDAAKNERLNSETYQRLALAMVLFVGSFVVAFGVAAASAASGGGGGPNAATCAGLCLAFGPAFATSVKAIREHGPGHDETWARVAKDFKEATNFGDRTEKGGYLELFYKLSFWTSLVVGGSFAFSPLSPLAIVNEMEPSSQLIQRAFGLATVFLLAPTQYALVDASRRGRLGGGTFKKLNLSIAASIALIDWMTVYTFQAATDLSPTADDLAAASGGAYNYVGALAVSASILAVYLFQGIAAKK